MAMFVQSLGDEYEAQTLIPYISNSNGPPIFWMYPFFGILGANAVA